MKFQAADFPSTMEKSISVFLPQYEEKTVTAHTDEELDYLYSRADEDQRFLLDFGLNSGFRDMELAHAEDTDLVGLLLEVKRKPHLFGTDYPKGSHPKKWHCRKVKVTPGFAAQWRERAKKLGGGLMLRAPEGGIETHLTDRWPPHYRCSFWRVDFREMPPGCALYNF